MVDSPSAQTVVATPPLSQRMTGRHGRSPVANKPKPDKKTARGKVYYYHKAGAGRRRIFSAPDTPAFDAEMRRAHDADKTALLKDNIASLCREYRNDVRF